VYDSREDAHRRMSNYDLERHSYFGVSDAANAFF
jgi:hypothetical protein